MQGYSSRGIWHLWQEQDAKEQARCKEPGGTQSTCKIPLPYPNMPFNPISAGILALGEGDEALAAPAQEAPRTQELGGYFYPSLKPLISIGLKPSYQLQHQPFASHELPRGDTSNGGLRAINGCSFWVISHLFRAVCNNPQAETHSNG